MSKSAYYIVGWAVWAESPFRKKDALIYRQTALEWYRSPIHPGNGRDRLRAACESPLDFWGAIGVFDTLCQLSASQSVARRGWLLSPRGMPLTLAQLAISIDPTSHDTVTRLIGALESAGWIAHADAAGEWSGNVLVRPTNPAFCREIKPLSADDENSFDTASTSAHVLASTKSRRGTNLGSDVGTGDGSCAGTGAGSAPQSHIHSHSHSHSHIQSHSHSQGSSLRTVQSSGARNSSSLTRGRKKKDSLRKAGLDCSDAGAGGESREHAIRVAVVGLADRPLIAEIVASAVTVEDVRRCVAEVQATPKLTNPGGRLRRLLERAGMPRRRKAGTR